VRYVKIRREKKGTQQRHREADDGREKLKDYKSERKEKGRLGKWLTGKGSSRSVVD